MEADHVMRPIRVRLAHSLVRTLGLDEHLDLCTAAPLEPADMLPAHTPELIDTLYNAGTICSDPARPEHVSLQTAGGCPCAGSPGLPLADETPLFPAVWDLVSSYAGASVAGAEALVADEADVAVNWAGGMHHAMPSNCFGFCHVNDIVLAIRRLRRRFRRVLYIDIDAHHGDGVEVAFVDDPTVMTYSLHQFGQGYFPGTGDVTDAGHGPGEGFAVNVPLPAGTGDGDYTMLFHSALRAVVSAFDPEAVVLQCGADTLFGDPVGGLRVSTHGWAECADAVVNGLGLPTLMLGGGGYNVPNTARAWAILTAVATQRYAQLPHELPPADPYFYPHYCCTDPLRAAESPDALIHAPLMHVTVPAGAAPQVAPTAVAGRKGAVSAARVALAAAAQRNERDAEILRHVHHCMRRVRLVRGMVVSRPLPLGPIAVENGRLAGLAHALGVHTYDEADHVREASSPTASAAAPAAKGDLVMPVATAS
jgi:acetoin utilization deacetylase AcuC-like enzyme